MGILQQSSFDGNQLMQKKQNAWDGTGRYERATVCVGSVVLIGMCAQNFA
jgi:hypothetical protein